jgi:hypothetical protein
MHELAHVLMISHFNLPIHEKCYFQLDSPHGYVEYSVPSRYFPAFTIAFSPLIFNTLLGIGAVWGGVVYAKSPSLIPPSVASIPTIVGVWLGFTFLYHAIPSDEDALNVWEMTKKRFWNPLAWLGFPIVAFLFITSKLQQYGVNFAYAFLICLSTYYTTSRGLLWSALFHVTQL